MTIVAICMAEEIHSCLLIHETGSTVQDSIAQCPSDREYLMGLDEEGYLSSELSAYRERIRACNAQYFEFFNKVQRFCHEKKFLLKPHNRDGQQIFATGLFVKLICDVEAAVILMERGLSSQSRSTDKASEYLQGV